MPPADELCREYYENRVAAEQEGSDGEQVEGGAAQNISRHRPYEEKKCNDCHDKTREGGLVRPQRELCFTCHAGFAKGKYVHGPVAVGDCLACHLPHRATFPSLLKADKKEICATCHRENRLIPGFHTIAADKQLVCVDCHDPHAGNAQYFLK